MPSLEAEAAIATIATQNAPRRYRSLIGTLEDVRDATAANDQPDSLPASVTSDLSMRIEQETFSSQFGAEWIVRHMSPMENSSSEKVFVYWHGGSFVTKVRYF